MIEKRIKNEDKNKAIDTMLNFVICEYDHRLKLFDRLDNKAQQIAGFSGVLLGLIANLSKEETIEFIYDKSPFCIFLLLTCSLALVCSFSLSIYCLLVSEFTDRPSFLILKNDFHEVVRDSSLLKDLKYDETTLWEKSLISLKSQIDQKARNVKMAQKSFGIALFSLGLSFSIELFLILTK